MIVKIMRGDGESDTSPTALFSLFADVESVVFERVGGVPTIGMLIRGREAHNCGFRVEGNVYVMNDAGKTIESFSPSPPEISGSGQTA